MDQQQDMDAAHGEALEIHAKAGHVREVVEDIYRVALTYQEKVVGILLQRRPSISWNTVSRRRTGRVAPSVPHGLLKRDALTAEGERKIRNNSGNSHGCSANPSWSTLRLGQAAPGHSSRVVDTPCVSNFDVPPHRTRANQCWVNAGAEGDINPFINFVAGQRPIQTRQ